MVWGVSLTCTHSYCVPRVVPTVVAVEAPVGVADRSFCAIVPQLLGTHLTTLTAVRDEADAHWAAGRGRRALARPLAKLRARGVLQRGRGGAHGRGGWRQGLWREGRHKGACPEEGSQAKGPQSPSHLYGVPKVHVKFQFSAMLWMARHLLSPHEDGGAGIRTRSRLPQFPCSGCWVRFPASSLSPWVSPSPLTIPQPGRSVNRPPLQKRELRL